MFYLLGSDYVYPQTTNLVLLEYLLFRGGPLESIGGGFRKDESGKIISAGKCTPSCSSPASALADDPALQRELTAGLAGNGDHAIPGLLDAWQRDALFVRAESDGTRLAVELSGASDAAGAQVAFCVEDGRPVAGSGGEPLRLAAAELAPVGHNSALRRAMMAVPAGIPRSPSSARPPWLSPAACTSSVSSGQSSLCGAAAASASAT